MPAGSPEPACSEQAAGPIKHPNQDCSRFHLPLSSLHFHVQTLPEPEVSAVESSGEGPALGPCREQMAGAQLQLASSTECELNVHRVPVIPNYHPAALTARQVFWLQL